MRSDGAGWGGGSPGARLFAGRWRWRRVGRNPGRRCQVRDGIPPPVARGGSGKRRRRCCGRRSPDISALRPITASERRGPIVDGARPGAPRTMRAGLTAVGDGRAIIRLVGTASAPRPCSQQTTAASHGVEGCRREGSDTTAVIRPCVHSDGHPRGRTPFSQPDKEPTGASRPADGRLYHNRCHVNERAGS
jgi:hypothetical protein